MNVDRTGSGGLATICGESKMRRRLRSTFAIGWLAIWLFPAGAFALTPGEAYVKGVSFLRSQGAATSGWESLVLLARSSEDPAMPRWYVRLSAILAGRRLTISFVFGVSLVIWLIGTRPTTRILSFQAACLSAILLFVSYAFGRRLDEELRFSTPTLWAFSIITDLAILGTLLGALTAVPM